MGIEQDACAFDAHIILIWNEVIMGMEQEQTPHKRRVRYKGKYPKKYEEKYKELQPENTEIPLPMSSARAIRPQVCIDPLWYRRSWIF